MTESILIIDDEQNLRRSLALILQRAGYAAITAGDAREALQTLQAGAYDLAFLDLKLPDRNGMNLLPEMRRLRPEMPIIILTAHATLETAMEAVRQGARDYLLKPIDPQKVVTRVKEILDDQSRTKRRREIQSEVETLLTQLRQIDLPPTAPSEADPTPATTDPARFLRRGRFVLDLQARRVKLEGRAVALPPTTFDCLCSLVRHSPDPVSHETLVLEAQGYALPHAEAREMVRWHIHELRKALEPDPQHPRFIITVRHIGYRLAD